MFKMLESALNQDKKINFQILIFCYFDAEISLFKIKYGIYSERIMYAQKNYINDVVLTLEKKGLTGMILFRNFKTVSSEISENFKQSLSKFLKI